MGKPVSFILKDHQDNTVGLFYTNVDWRIDDVCNFAAWRWTDFAACLGTDPDAWFAHPSDPTDELKKICDKCIVRRECLSSALERDEWGYWAGTTREDRSLLLGRRRTGPKRKKRKESES